MGNCFCHYPLEPAVAVIAHLPSTLSDNEKSSWYISTTTSKHITHDITLFTSYEPLPRSKPRCVILHLPSSSNPSKTKRERLSSPGFGEVVLRTTEGVLSLDDVWFVPGCPVNLISDGELSGEGMLSMITNWGRMQIRTGWGNRLLGVAEVSKGMYRLKLAEETKREEGEEDVGGSKEAVVGKTIVSTTILDGREGGLGITAATSPAASSCLAKLLAIESVGRGASAAADASAISTTG